MRTAILKGNLKVFKQIYFWLQELMPWQLKGKTKVLYTCFLWLFIFLTGFYSYSQNADSIVEVVEPPINSSKKDSSYFDVIPKHYVPIIYKRHINDSTIKQMQLDEDFWYANRNIPKKKINNTDSTNYLSQLLQQKWIKTLLWILILTSFAAIIIWYLSSLNIKLFRKAPTAISATEQEGIANNIFAINFDKSIAEAIQKSNFRLAVRLHYLQTLTHLAQKGLIDYKQDKTNSEYLAQLYKTDYYKDFFALTRRFEYTWYGQFNLSQATFEAVQKEFERFNKQLT